MVGILKYCSLFIGELLLVNSPVQLIVLSSILAAVLWFVFSGKSKKKQGLSWEEEEELLKDFEPDPLVPETFDGEQFLYKKRVVQSRGGKYVTVDGKECLNLATYNYLGFIDDAEISRKAADSISKYGVGSCGPRGFYGTADVHLELEERLAAFMNVEEACVYSYGFSTAASAIPAYCKRRDVIFVDEAANFAIQKGLDAARSTVKFFRHNDTAHLEELLKKQDAEDAKRRGKENRRFLVAEGIYANTGLMCPLPELVRLRAKYRLRFFLDETISIGAIGETGRGVMEYFNVPKEEVDLRIGSMEGSLASVGGFCCGTSFIVEHQRLSGLGYCFSASLPPLLAVAATTALSHLESNPQLIKKLNKISIDLQEVLKTLPGVELSAHELSPVKLLHVKESVNYTEDLKKLQQVSEICFSQGLAIVPSAILPQVDKMPRASLRVVANVLLDQENIEFVRSTLAQACTQVFA